MQLREAMLLDPVTGPKTYFTTKRSLPAEQELLELLLPWLLREYPDRFALAQGGAAVETLTDGYRRTFVLGEWCVARQPILGRPALRSRRWR